MRTPLFFYRSRRWMRRFGRPALLAFCGLVIGAGTLLFLWRAAPPPAVERPAASVTSFVPPPSAKDVARLADAQDAKPAGKGMTDISDRPAFTIPAPFQSVDVVTLKRGEQVVHLAGAEGPAAGDSCTDSDGYRWACGLRARAALHNLVANKTIVCTPRQAIGPGEITALCRMTTSQGADLGDLAEHLVRAGWARSTADGERALKALQEEARAKRLGLWRERWNVDDGRPG